MDSVPIPRKHARTDTSALSAKSQDTSSATARREKDLKLGLHPKYLRYNTWDPHDGLSPSSADWTITAPPIPPIPEKEILNPVVAKTVNEHPELFKVVTPINVDQFENLLQSHPNRPFVESVCKGLREGFWPPGADTHAGVYPDTLDESLPPPHDDRRAAFLENQIKIECEKGRFSGPFGPDLLPGMYCMPIHAVPKPNSDDFRLVNDHSFGDFSLNSMIPKSDHATYPLDNLHLLGEVLLTLHDFGPDPDPDRELVMWKSDIAEAYRLIPMHPFWQVKQIVRVGSKLYADHNAVFGNRESGDLFVSFAALVTWIAREIRAILFPLGYVDDNFGPNLKDDVELYEPYAEFLPTNQCRLLTLWDHIGIPHKRKKQISGSPLVIIGIEVDPNLLTFTLPSQAKADLLDNLAKFCARHPKRRGGPPTGSASFSLKEWQRLAGWLNWSFNVFPLLRPCLANVYAKISEKVNSKGIIYINNLVREDLEWAANHIKHSSGVYLLKSLRWATSDADITIYCDASLDSLGFWYPELHAGFHATIPELDSPCTILVFECFCVVSALRHASQFATNGARIVIYTDSENTVNMFSALRALPRYNPMIKQAVDILISKNLQLRVLHIPGSENGVADALSRSQLHRASELHPGIRLNTFKPPPLRLGPLV
jgi:hypothetical protein